MPTKLGALDLAKKISGEIIANSNSCLPFKVEENLALLDRYEYLRKSLLDAGVASPTPDGWAFKAGLDLAELDGTLLMQITELAVVWKASPSAIIKSLVILPEMLEASIGEIQRYPAGEARVQKNIALYFVERFNDMVSNQQFLFDE